MKTILPAILLAFLLTATAQAEDKSLEFCTKMGNIAEAIMTKRQNNVDVAAMLKIANENKNDKLKDILIKLIGAAYGKTHYSTESYKEKAIRNFKNDTTISCMRGLSILSSP